MAKKDKSTDRLQPPKAPTVVTVKKSKIAAVTSANLINERANCLRQLRRVAVREGQGGFLILIFQSTLKIYLTDINDFVLFEHEESQNRLI